MGLGVYVLTAARQKVVDFSPITHTYEERSFVLSQKLSSDQVFFLDYMDHKAPKASSVKVYCGPTLWCNHLAVTDPYNVCCGMPGDDDGLEISSIQG